MAKPVHRASDHMPEVLDAQLSPSQRPIELTTREQTILKLVWLGAQNQEIAEDLSISVRTVEAHRAMMMRKFSVRNVAQLLRTALLGGFLKLQ